MYLGNQSRFIKYHKNVFVWTFLPYNNCLCLMLMKEVDDVELYWVLTIMLAEQTMPTIPLNRLNAKHHGRTGLMGLSAKVRMGGKSDGTKWSVYEDAMMLGRRVSFQRRVWNQVIDGWRSLLRNTELPIIARPVPTNYYIVCVLCGLLLIRVRSDCNGIARRCSHTRTNAHITLSNRSTTGTDWWTWAKLFRIEKHYYRLNVLWSYQVNYIS